MKRHFTPCTIDFLAERIWAALEQILIEEDRYSLEHVGKIQTPSAINKIMAVAMFDFSRLTPQVKKDLCNVKFCSENVTCNANTFGHSQENAIVGFHRLDNQFAFLGVEAGGDWQYPVFFIIYWDGKELRGYIPKDGNSWNTGTMEAYGNNAEKDAQNAKKRFRVDDYDDLVRDHTAILNDIRKNIVLRMTKTATMTVEQLEAIKSDLAYQLTFEEIDWEYFLDTAKEAARIQKLLIKTEKDL